jgi:hypothetical protein
MLHMAATYVGIAAGIEMRQAVRQCPIARAPDDRANDADYVTTAFTTGRAAPEVRSVLRAGGTTGRHSCVARANA